MSNKKLIDEFNQLKTDVERWVWVKSHQHTGVVVSLDNDDTFIVIGDLDATFDNYIGWSDGVQELLKAMGISAEPV